MKIIYMLSVAATATLISCSPKEYTVSRSVEIDAPADVVFNMVNNHKMRDQWSPWEAMDRNMTKAYSGPESGVGAMYTWKGNDSVGTGTLEILESRSPEFLKSKLIFTEPWESESVITWTFEGSGEMTKATWNIQGELPGYLFWMGQEDMEEAMAPDFERGLNNLKEIAEKAKPMNTMTVELLEVSPTDYVYIRETVGFGDVDSAFFSERYGKLAAFLGDDVKNMSGAPFAVYHKWDEATSEAEISVSMPVKTSKNGNNEIAKGKTYGGMVMKVDYYGPYEKTGIAHNFMADYAASNGLEIIESPWETYVTDPATEQDPNKWLTQIYYPVRKLEQM